MHPEVAGDLTALLASIKNRIKVSGLFWKFRHIVHGNIWQNYYESYTSKRRHFYSCFVEKEFCNTIFEFGCASGPNLKNIEVYSNRTTYFCGYDINQAAVKFAKQKFDPKKSLFVAQISKSDLRAKLHSWGFEKFDLAIYDRVLYLLSDDEVFEHFSQYQDLLAYVIIDDFHNSQTKDSDRAYTSKNYASILSNFGFQLMSNVSSEHAMMNDFFERSARRLVFKKS